MEVPGHVNMTRDAVLLTAEAVAASNTERQAELADAGVLVDPGVLVERRLAALVELLLDEDDQARLELAYQEKLAAWLHSDTVAAAVVQARQARLLAPPGAFHQAANGGR